MSNVQSFVYSNGKRYLHRFVCGCVVPSFLLFFHLNCTNVIIIRCSCLCCWFSFSFLRSLGESCVWVLILACSQLVHSLRFIAISTILQNLLQFFSRLGFEWWIYLRLVLFVAIDVHSSVCIVTEDCSCISCVLQSISRWLLFCVFVSLSCYAEMKNTTNVHFGFFFVRCAYNCAMKIW